MDVTDADAIHDDSDDGLAFAADLPQGIVKEIVTSASADSYGRPSRFDDVSIRYVGIDPATGDELGSSGQNFVTFTLGKGRVIQGWELAIKTMRRGEKSRFTVDQEFLIAKEGMLPQNLPGKPKLVFDIELVRYVHRRDIFGDGSVVRTILKVGESRSKPKDGDEVIMSYKVFSAQNGSVIDERASWEYKIGSGALGVIGKAVDKALLSTKKGSVVSLECTKDYSDQDDGVTAQLCLEEIYVIEDICWGKSKVAKKKRIKEGNADAGPQEGDNVRLSVEKVTDGAEILAGFVGPTVLDFTWGDGEICEVLELASAKMTKNERALISTPHTMLCHDKQLGLSDIDAKRVLFTIELVDFQEGTFDIVAPDFQSKLEFAAARKDVGARLFKEQRYRLAFDRYAYVVKVLHDSFQCKGKTGEFAKDIEELETACQLNQAACLLKMNDFAGAIHACGIVLGRKPHNVKALFRRANAHHSRGEYMDAIRDLRQAIELEPQNTEARRLLQQAKQAQQDEDKSSKSVFAKMCSQAPDEGLKADSTVA